MALDPGLDAEDVVMARTLEAMEMFGTRFVAHLASTYRAGTPAQRTELRGAFPGFFVRYREKAEERYRAFLKEKADG